MYHLLKCANKRKNRAQNFFILQKCLEDATTSGQTIKV
jgi:hypothetical protein